MLVLRFVLDSLDAVVRSIGQGQKACLLRVEIFAENTTRCLDHDGLSIMV